MRLNSGMTLTLGGRRASVDPATALLASIGFTSLYHADDADTVAQTLPNRLNGAAVAAQRGSTTDVDINDPLFGGHAGTHYVRLPGTSGNSITYPRPFATTHYTITWMDNTTTTGTTTANPVVIGGTAHAGLVKSVVLRDTNSGGTIGETLIVANEIDTTSDPDAGQASFGGWTVTRSTSGPKTAVVTSGVVLPDGSNDWLHLPASDLPTFTATTGQYCAVYCYRTFEPSGPDNPTYLGIESVGGQGLFFFQNGGLARCQVAGASATVNVFGSGSPTSGQLFVVAAVVDAGAVKVWDSGADAFGSPGSVTGVGSIAFAANPRLCARSDGSLAASHELKAFAVGPIAPSSAELGDVAEALIE